MDPAQVTETVVPALALPSLDPSATLLFCGFVAGGVALGTVSGLTPGIHANTFALLLAGVAPSGDYVSGLFQHRRHHRRPSTVS